MYICTCIINLIVKVVKIGPDKNTLHFQTSKCGRHRILWEDVKYWSRIEEQCELRECFTTLLYTRDTCARAALRKELGGDTSTRV